MRFIYTGRTATLAYYCIYTMFIIVVCSTDDIECTSQLRLVRIYRTSLKEPASH